MKNDKFTTGLAIADMLPVLFFGIAATVLGLKLQSGIFFAGAFLCILAGAGKVLWKFLIALADKDVPLLGAQLRYLMPAGFILIVIGAVRADRAIVYDLVKAAVRMPSLLFFIISACGIGAMVMCARKYDRHDVRGNRIEQGINAAAQASLMIGVLFL